MTKTTNPGLFTAEAQDAVECLGITFPDDAARQTFFIEKLREQLKDAEFRKTEGFPIGTDEDILAMSDPPYYTACPNPFLDDYIRLHGKPFDRNERYHREPLAVDSSEGKTDALYSAHAYHTKVPHKAIIRAILHYTNPGDVVLDGFSGSGMTGVAAQMCGTPEPDLKKAIEEESRSQGARSPKWGIRKVILNDLGPAATYIARGYNLPFRLTEFVDAGERLLRRAKNELSWLYETQHKDGKTKGLINYTIWSECLRCPNCGHSLVFFDEALDPKTKRIYDSFPCPKCESEVTKDNLERVMETLVDPATGMPWQRVRFVPVQINYSVGGKKFEKKLDQHDLDVLTRIGTLPIPAAAPTSPFPIERMYHGSRLAPKGFSRVHHLFIRRALFTLGTLWEWIKEEPSADSRHMLHFFVEQGIRGMSLLNRYKPIQYGKIGGSQVGLDLNGVYYVPSISTEVSPWYQFEGKLQRLQRAFAQFGPKPGNAIISTGMAARLKLPDKSVDYVFTDPPFGENIFYADLNFLVEAWYGVTTNTKSEAVVDKFKDKGLLEYQALMRACFGEYYRVLKPGRWMTVVFHNSKNAVWNAIQEAIFSSGFVVADVRTLDKQQGSYRQVTSSAVKQDLIISAYRPGLDLEDRFKVAIGSEDSAWEFVQGHLTQVPLFVSKDGRVQVVAERQAYILYDRMVAFHVQRGYAVPISSAEFHVGLRRRFLERDGMYFVPTQSADYDRRRSEVKALEQYELFVSDEKSAIQWVRRQLTEHPLTYQTLQPLYMKEAQRVWEKHEQPLELRIILEENFVEDSDGTWRVPNPTREADLEQLRHRALMKEFQIYLGEKGKLKVVRTEALRAGFKECWQKQDYKTIVQMAKQAPESAIQEDQALLMYYDNALMRRGE